MDTVWTTNLHTSQTEYNKHWLKYRADRTTSPGQTWLFTDGSSSGWHAVNIVKPGIYCRSICKFSEPTPTRNIAAELNALILGLEHLFDESVNTVADYLGVMAWPVGAWKMKDPEVIERVARIKDLINNKCLNLNFIHHSGHQDMGKNKDSSDFTRWNALTDRMCGNKEEVDSIVSYVHS